MNKSNAWLVALPVYNEVQYVDSILDMVVQHADEVLVVDDGSTDGTSDVLARRDDIHVIHHPANRGYSTATDSINRNEFPNSSPQQRMLTLFPAAVT